MTDSNRRSFIKKVAIGGSLATMAVPAILEARPGEREILRRKHTDFAPGDKIRLAAIGMGIMGYNNMSTALQVPGVELVAVCDLYDGRLQSSKENFGDQLFTTRDYKKILDRDDIDAVCISTSDHWHDKITIEALEKGKAVYCEKPMVQKIEQGQAVVDAEKRTGQVLQIGSQPVSSILKAKAREIYQSGAIGELVLAETYTDRFSPNGAWQYSIPTDASPKTVDWKRFIGDGPKRDFDPRRFFRWRNYQDYGTGVAGDLFVHLFSGLHVTLDTTGPNKIYASGGLRYWEDGRDVPDVMLAVVDYPENDSHSAFNLQIRVNFVASNGQGNVLKLIGTEGTMDVGWTDLTIRKNKLPNAPGYGGWDSFETFTAAQKKDYEKWYKETYPESYEIYEPGEKVYSVPRGYSDHLDHWSLFFDAMRNGTKIVEDGEFGLRAVGPSLATNLSLFGNKIINWDPDGMKLM